MKRTIYITLGFLLVLITFNYSKIKLGYRYYVSPCFYSTPVKQNDFPQEFLEIDLDNYYSEIDELSTPYFKIDTLETVTYKNKAYPVLSLTQNESKSLDKKLLIVAGVHGNESGGTLSILELLKQYNANPHRFKNWNIKIITPVNPVGTAQMSRYNECGCDLNRKVNSSSQKGIVIQRNVMINFNPDIVVSMHEAPSAGFLIHSNKYLNDELLVKMLQETEEKGIQLSTKDYLGRELPMAGNSKITGSLKLLNKILQVQALGDYATDKGIVEITTESGWNTKDRFQRVNSHVLLVLSLIDNY